jgi:hypothetical protein
MAAMACRGKDILVEQLNVAIVNIKLEEEVAQLNAAVLVETRILVMAVKDFIPTLVELLFIGLEVAADLIMKTLEAMVAQEAAAVDQVGQAALLEQVVDQLLTLAVMALTTLLLQQVEQVEQTLVAVPVEVVINLLVVQVDPVS